MKTFFFKITTKKAAAITTVTAFFVVICFFIGTYFYAKYWESQLLDGIEIENFVLRAERADISFLQGTIDIKNLHIYELENKEGSFFSVQKISISGISTLSFVRSDTLLLAKKVTLTRIKGKYRKGDTSISVALKGASFGEVWGSPLLLFSKDANYTTSALLSLSFRASWFFGLTGEYSSSEPLHESVLLSSFNSFSDKVGKTSSSFGQNQNFPLNGRDMSSSLTRFERKNNFMQSHKISQKIFFELLQKIDKHASWNMELAKVDFFSLTRLEDARFSNIHLAFGKEEVASLDQLGLQQAEYSAVGLGIPFSNIKELTLEKLRLPNKKDGDTTLSNARMSASLLFNGVSLDFSLHELSLPKKVSPFSFQNILESQLSKKSMPNDSGTAKLLAESLFDKHIIDTSFRGILSFADEENKKDTLCAWRADAFVFYFAGIGTLSGKASGLLHDAIDSFIQVDSLGAKFNDTFGNSRHRSVEKTRNVDKVFFYWLITGKNKSEEH